MNDYLVIILWLIQDKMADTNNLSTPPNLLYIFNCVIRLNITFSNMLWDLSHFKSTHEKEQNYIIVS